MTLSTSNVLSTQHNKKWFTVTSFKRLSAYMVVILLGLLLFFGCFYYYYLPLFQDWDHHYFGDDGDGFFNLWVLRHNATYFWEHMFTLNGDGRIYYPENKYSLFFSDTLYFPAIFYKIGLMVFDQHAIAAFNFCNICLAFCRIFIIWAFFSLVLDFLVLSPVKILFQILLTAVCAFSAPAASFSAHFQNYSAFWLIGFVTGFMGYWKNIEVNSKTARRWLFYALLSLLIANYSAAYYGVMSCTILMCFGLVYLLGFGWQKSVELLKREWWFFAGAVVGLLPIVYFYSRVQSLASSGINWGIVIASAVHVGNLLIPTERSLAFDFWNQFFPVPSISHEKQAFAGIGFFIAGVWSLSYLRFNIYETIFKYLRHPSFYILLVSVALSAVIRSLAPILVYPAVFAVMWMTYIFLVWIGSVWAEKKMEAINWILILVAVVIYGFCSGPMRLFVDQTNLNPSHWWIMATFIPGLAKIRAIGRFGALGLVILWGLVARFLLQKSIKTPHSTWIQVTLVVLLLMNLAEHQSTAFWRTTDVQSFTPTSEEAIFFEKNPGIYWVNPAGDWPPNTRYMLYFQMFPKITMINGYSGRSTEIFDFYSSKERATPDFFKSQHEAFLERKVIPDRTAVFKDRLTADQVKLMYESFPDKPIFDNERIAVFSRL